MRGTGIDRAPLIILGLDAGDPDLILAWARAGQLPAIASILERGSYGRLVGRDMISVHGVWLSFFSGVSVHQHGYYAHRALRPGTYRLESLHSRDLQAPPFWACFQAGGQRALLVDVPDGYPLPQLNGLQVLNWGNHPTRAAPAAQPEELLQEIRAVVGAPIETDESQGSLWQDRRELARILRRVERKGALCQHLLSKGRFDLIVVVFGDSHAAGHRFRKYIPAPAAAGAGDLEQAMLRTYQAIDRELGRLLQQCPPESNVFVVSNSGLDDGYPTTSLMEMFCRRLGYETRADPTRGLARARAVYRDRLPEEWRSRLGRWWRPLEQAEPFGEGVDWRRTTAFAIPAYYTGYLRVNLKGREPLGVVEAGADYEAVLARLESDLFQLADADTGAPVIERVTRTAEVFGGGPPQCLPDLVVDWRPSSRLALRITHPKAVLARRRAGAPRDNHHSRIGLVLAAGPSIRRRGCAGDFSPLDFAPLFRHLLGEPAGPPGPALAAFGAGAG